MEEPVKDSERSPKGDHNRRLALGIDPDVFARKAGVTTEQLREYERTSPDHKFDLAVAHQVGITLTWFETGRDDTAPAFRRGSNPNPGDPSPIRPSGLDAMRDPADNWEKVDEAVDESFPASDPPGANRFE